MQEWKVVAVQKNEQTIEDKLNELARTGWDIYQIGKSFANLSTDTVTIVATRPKQEFG